MSLLDDVSIVVTPNGYKAGELYAVVPVPTYGTEEVVNGDFATDTNWSKGAGWSIGGGTANVNYATFADMYQTIGSSVGKSYKITFEVSNYVSGGVVLLLGYGGTSKTVEAYANGVYESYVTVNPTGSANLYISTIVTNTNLSIDNVSVKEYTSADMDVTRATAATRVDENGLVNYAEVIGSDLVTNGDFATDLSGWSNKSSTSTWVSGSARIDNSIGNANSGLFQDIGLILGKTYTLTATLKLISADSNGNFVVLTSNSGGGGQTRIYTGNALVIGGASVTETIEFTTADSDVSIQFACDTTNAIFEVDNVSVKEVTRDNVPRIDYTGGGCPHILAEPMRTNLIPYSEDYNGTGWGLTGSSINATSVPSPDGVSNMSELRENTSLSSHRIYKSSITVANNSTNSISFFVKSNGRNWIVLYEEKSATGYYFNIQTGLLGSFFGSEPIGHKITNFGNGVFKISITVTVPLQLLTPTIYMTTANSASLSYQGDGTSGIYLWGAQSEEGSYPTSYIPTSGSTVTRNQDIFTRDGIGSLINSTEGVLFLEVAALADDGIDRYITLSDGGLRINAIRIYYFNTGGFIFFQKYVGGTRTTNMSTTSYTQTSFNKLAIRYNSTTVDVWANGVKILTNADTNAITSGTLNSLKLSQGDGTNTFFGKVKQLQVYDTALTDTQLAALTS